MSEKAFNINPNFNAKKKIDKNALYYIEGIKNKDRFILSEAITLAESDDEDKQTLSNEILDSLKTTSIDNNTIRISVTGSPGVGKSTFIEHFGKWLADQDLKVAVLAIDPSSQLNHGSILGDKTRMQELSIHENGYIRPSSSGEIMGGVSKGTKEAIVLCEAAGYQIILVETVGVGQSEFWASKLTDITILLLQPGAGDDLQGIKRGVMEMADIILVNKADHDLKEVALQTAKNYQSIASLFKQKLKNVRTEIQTFSSFESKDFEPLLGKINDFIEASRDEKFFIQNRIEQEQFWFETMIKEELFKAIIRKNNFSSLYENLLMDIKEKRVSANSAINKMRNHIFNKLEN